jgi:hypothetical protein
MPNGPYCHQPADPEGCRLCRRYVNDRAFAEFMDAVPPPGAAVERKARKIGRDQLPSLPLTCVHLGGLLRREGGCRGCGDAGGVPVHACAVHEECSPETAMPGMGCCRTCPDRRVRVPEPPPPRLNPQSPRAVVTAAAGSEGQALLALSGPWLRAYAKRLGADFVVLDWPGFTGWGPSTKFQLFHVLDAYDWLAFLDADTLADPAACPDLAALVPPGHFGVYDDLPGLTRRGNAATILKEFARVQAALGLPAAAPAFYGNTGVMVLDRSHRGVVAPPAEPIPPDHRGEQDVFVARLAAGGVPITFLDAACNRQWWEWGGFKQPYPGSILHFSGIRPQRDAAERLAIMKRAARDFILDSGPR